MKKIKTLLSGAVLTVSAFMANVASAQTIAPVSGGTGSSNNVPTTGTEILIAVLVALFVAGLSATGFFYFKKKK